MSGLQPQRFRWWSIRRTFWLQRLQQKWIVLFEHLWCYSHSEPAKLATLSEHCLGSGRVWVYRGVLLLYCHCHGALLPSAKCCYEFTRFICTTFMQTKSISKKSSCIEEASGFVYCTISWQISLSKFPMKITRWTPQCVSPLDDLGPKSMRQWTTLHLRTVY